MGNESFSSQNNGGVMYAPKTASRRQLVFREIVAMPL
jgi:hypothetical protein